MKNIIDTRLDPLDDFIFYKVFGETGDEVQLLSFINAVLGKKGDDKFVSVEILENTSYMAEIMGGKSCTLDVKAQLPTGAMVNIEVQLDDRYNMNRRSLFYLSREYNRILKFGDNYNKLPDLIAINIVNYNFPATKNFHSCFHLREDTEHDFVLSKALEIHYINMVKYRKQGKGKLDDPLCRWLAWLNRNSSAEHLEEAINMDAAIKAADERMVNVTTMSADEFDAYFRYKQAKWEQAHAINEVKTMIARNALSKGATLEFISDITGLSREDIKEILI
ncbi:MAG: Rpn family recombination-promoting nuclease/putative transposase [Treponema sp.]|nr:Rpn family recombination-promoting nuclease/putative transposase [Treponema sp.]